MTDMPSREIPTRHSERQSLFLILVDGNATELFSTGMLLQRLEYNVFTAGSAEEALRFMEIARPSVLITELLLPNMSGMDLLTRIKQEPGTRDIPVIIHTHMKDIKVEEICKLAGCAAYLRKPADPNTLFRSIQYVMEKTPRHYIRLATCIKVLVGDEGEDGQHAECVTALSENGIFVRTFKPRPVNALLPIRFPIGDRLIHIRALVLYTYPLSGGPLKEPGMGMKFVEIAEGDRECIREFIKARLTKDLAY